MMDTDIIVQFTESITIPIHVGCADGATLTDFSLHFKNEETESSTLSISVQLMVKSEHETRSIYAFSREKSIGAGASYNVDASPNALIDRRGRIYYVVARATTTARMSYRGWTMKYSHPEPTI